MISPEQRAEIRRLYYAEHWRVGTIATTLGVHHDTVRHAIEADRFIRPGAQIRPSALDPYKPFVLATLEQYPRLRATRLYEMLGARGYAGSVVQVRRWVRTVRSALDQTLERFLRGHVEAFAALAGAPGTILYDNLKSVVLARAGDHIRFHPRVLELAGHYHFAPQPCAPYRGNEKGKVERMIQ